MKYIKLNNNRIYDVRHLKIDGPLKDSLPTELFVGYSGKSYGTSQPGVISLNHLCNVNDIVGESDDIEELCDECVIYAEDCKPCKYFLSQGHKEDILANPNIDLREYLKTRSIYGAIWTDKGLIYVAKMNERGEFELL